MRAYMSRRSGFATSHLAPLVLTVQTTESKSGRRDQIHRRPRSISVEAGMRLHRAGILPATLSRKPEPWHPRAFGEAFFDVDPTS